MRIGEAAEPVPRFQERAVVLVSPEGPTILAASALKGTERAFGGVAEALGTALGARTTIGEPLLAFAAQLRPDPLAYPTGWVLQSRPTCRRRSSARRAITRRSGK